ncbi:MAG TPA: endonuclease/exonuclease/phosphatase family protein [Gemmatimonadaceae bacterium]|nr:endonuclease/exonuclease/phosphatase family protein [Gemmatimonadaceae bacterium]
MTARLHEILSLSVLTASMACAGAAPSAPGGSAVVTAARVMTYNIRHGAGNDGCATPPSEPGTPPSPDCALNLERIAAIIRAERVDVAGLQEVDRFWARSGMVDQPAALGAMLGMQTCYGANLAHPPDAHSAAPHEYGTLVLSRYPIVACGNTLLPRAGTASEQRGLLHARIRPGDVTVDFYNTHLHTAEADRRLQVDAIVRQIESPAERVILVGDLNARPTESYLAPLFAMLKDAWAIAGAGPGFTSPASPAQPPINRIDYVLVSPALAVTAATILTTPQTAVASDHYPVVCDVKLSGAAPGSAGLLLPSGRQSGSAPIATGPLSNGRQHRVDR